MMVLRHKARHLQVGLCLLVTQFSHNPVTAFDNVTTFLTPTFSSTCRVGSRLESKA